MTTKHRNNKTVSTIIRNLNINLILIIIALALMLLTVAVKANAGHVYQATSQTQLTEIIKHRLEAFDEEFTVRMVWDYTTGQVVEIIDNALANALRESSPYIVFNFYDRFVSGYGVDGDTTNTFEVEYRTNAADEMDVESWTSNIVTNITNGLETDEQKSLAIYTWVVANITHGSGFGAYQALTTNGGAYTAFALLTQKLHDQAGIPAKIVARTPGIHAWNLVQFCGKWFHLDTFYQRFNLSDAEMLAFIDWNTDVIPALPTADQSYSYPVCQMAPVANAGTDVIADENEVVTLNATNSYHPNGDDIYFQWFQTSGPAVVLNDSDTATPYFTTPTVGVGGAVLELEVVVSDGSGSDSSDSVIVVVTYANQPPVADAGFDMTVPQFATVYLDGSGSSDPDDGIASYHWEQISGYDVVLNDANTIEAWFTAPEVDDNGLCLEFQLTVTDNSGLVATDRVVVNVTNVNNPPVADAGQDLTVRQGEWVTLDAGGSNDSDGEIISYQWRQVSGPTVTLSAPNEASTTFRAPWENITLVFEVTVTDNGTLQATDSVSVQVTGGNSTVVSTDAGGGGGGCFMGSLSANHSTKGIVVMNRLYLLIITISIITIVVSSRALKEE